MDLGAEELPVGGIEGIQEKISVGFTGVARDWVFFSAGNCNNLVVRSENAGCFLSKHIAFLKAAEGDHAIQLLSHF